MLNIEELVNIILNKSEQLEEEVIQNSELKNITPKQLHCIEIIFTMMNPTLSELTQKLKITKPSASVMIDRLEEQGYLFKVKSDSDKRAAHVHLTDKGFKAARLHNEVHTQFSRLLTKDLTDSERDILIVLLNKATQSLIEQPILVRHH